MLFTPPDPQVFDGPGVIRWAVGAPEGPRSHTWSVVGHNSEDEVFVGIRDHMEVIKLSLHKAKWRMALTEKAAEQHLPPEVDRVMTRWNQPDETAQGWRHATCILIPTSNLGPSFKEKRVRKGGRITWLPAPEGAAVFRFDVMLATPDAEQLEITNAVEVGRMRLRSGAGVWVTVCAFPSTPEYEERLGRIRREIESHIPETAAPVRGWAWGATDEGVPQLEDVSGVDSRFGGENAPSSPDAITPEQGWFGYGRLR